jgi:DNA-binding XRE family transcriptional regulator
VSEAAQFLRTRLKELRAASALTQEEFAELARIPYKVYQHIEAGRRVNPQLETLEKMAKAFGLTVNDLFAYDMPKPRLKRKTRAGRARPK